MPCLDISKFVISPKGLEEVPMLVPIRTSSSDMVAARGGMGYLLACIVACNIRETLQWLYILLISTSMPCQRCNAKHRCKKPDSAEFEDEDFISLRVLFFVARACVCIGAQLQHQAEC